MPRLFRLAGAKASALQEASFPSRDALRRVVEENLQALFEVTYLESNFHLVDLPDDAPPEVREIDTLAFDTHTYAPVAIEYRDRVNAEIASQGVAILRAVPTQSQIVKYLVKRAGFNPERIDWTKMRVLFVARDVVPPGSIASRSLRGGIELWEAALHTGDVLMLDHVATFPLLVPAEGGPSQAAEAPPAEDFSL
jgi:hypothetical protein